MTNPSPMAPSHRTISSKIAVVLVVIALVTVIVWRVVHKQRGIHQQQTCKTRLRQIGAALHEYYAQHGSFPPAYILGPDGKRWHSWRVLLLPFLGEQQLQAAYQFDEPWDGPRNRQLALRIPPVFECPAADGVGHGIANYLAIVGRRSAWPEHLALKIRDFDDGTINTALLVESADSDINWLEPRDITTKQLLNWNKASSAPRCCSRHPGEPNRHLLMGDGTVRRMSDSINPTILGSLITPSFAGTYASKILPASDGDAPDAVFPKEREASELPQTDVVPVTSAAMIAGRNRLYCCTLRMVWDELRQPPDAKVHIPQPPLIVEELNKAPFPKGCLNPNNCLVQVESLRDVGKIHAEMARRFPGARGPRTRASNLPGFVVFAYLRKSLPFAAYFDSLEQPLDFPRGNSGSPVPSFGRLRNSSRLPDDRLSQVRVHSYASDDDFVIELQSTSHNDTLLLAKIPPQSTLQNTIDATMQRVRKVKPPGHRGQLEDNDDLIIPKLSLNLLCEYSELEGLQLPDFDARIGAPATIAKVMQGIAFVLNERGAELESFAEAENIGSDGPDDPLKPRRFVFNRPFLVLLSERNAVEPYFALWIENTELMQSAH